MSRMRGLEQLLGPVALVAALALFSGLFVPSGDQVKYQTAIVYVSPLDVRVMRR